MGSESVEVKLDPRTPVRKVQVSFVGLKRLSPDVLIRNCCGELDNVRTLGEMHMGLQQVALDLGSLNIFKQVKVQVAPGDEAGVIHATFLVDESRHSLQAGANVNKALEASCDAKGEVPCFLGGLTSLSGSVSYSWSNTYELMLRLFNPRFLNQWCTASLEAAQTSSDYKQTSSYANLQRQVQASLTDLSGRHSIVMESSLRDMLIANCQGPGGCKVTPSNDIMQSRLRSMKTSLRYSYTGDILEGLHPSLSSCAQGNIEGAGLVGDVSFLRTEGLLGIGGPLPRFSKLLNLRDVCWSVTGSCGFLLPFDKQRSAVQDRFFLGGGSISGQLLKGFAQRGIGPVGLRRFEETEGQLAATDGSQDGKTQKTDALGGDAHASLYATLSCPLNLQSSQGLTVRPFCFLNVGSLVDVVRRSIFSDFAQQTRASVGVGFSLPFPMAGGVFELTLAHPLRASKEDILQRTQLGVRLGITGDTSTAESSNE